MPVSVHLTLPTSPTECALVTAHAVMAAGRGVIQLADKKLV